MKVQEDKLNEAIATAFAVFDKMSTDANATTHLAFEHSVKAMLEEFFGIKTDECEVDSREHNHYFKYVGHLEYIDVYRVLDLFDVKDQAVGHAAKKLLCAGVRGAGKDFAKDIKEARDSLNRKLEMLKENELSFDNTPITASLVTQLREMTGYGLTECKKALLNTGGNLQKASEWLGNGGLR